MQTKIAYTSICFILFITAGASDLANNKNLIVAAVGAFGFAYFYYSQKLEYYLIALLGLFFSIATFYFFRNEGIDPTTYFGFFLKVFLAYFCRYLCKENFYQYLVNIVFILACISLPLFVLQLGAFDLVYKLNNFFGGTGAMESKANSIIFNCVPIHATRNSGFMWEPGAYAAMLTLIIYLNTFLLGNPLLSRRNVIMMVAIFTTQSTMGFLSLFLPFGFMYYDKFKDNKVYRRLAIILIPIFLVTFSTLFSRVEFLSGKINEEFAGIDVEMDMVDEAMRDDFVFATTRITSFLLEWKTVKNFPLFGLGIDYRTTGANELYFGENIVTACGTSALLLRFGFVGMLLYLFLFYRSTPFEKPMHQVGWVIQLMFVLYSNEISGSAFFHLFIF